MAVAPVDQTIQHYAMLTRLYVEALLADSVLADQVWDLWHVGAISDETAAFAWLFLAHAGSGKTI